MHTEVGGQAVLGRQFHHTTPWLTERYGYLVTVKLLLLSISVGVGGEPVLGRQNLYSTPWLTERHGLESSLLGLLPPSFSLSRILFHGVIKKSTH